MSVAMGSEEKHKMKRVRKTFSLSNMQKSGRAALARSRSIDHQIDEERERRQKEVQLLILGGAGSGKSTFIKQLRLHYGDGFPESDRGQFVSSILQNCCNALNVILDMMNEMNVVFEKEDTKRTSADFRKKYPRISLQVILKKFTEDQEDAANEESATLRSHIEITKRLSTLNILNPDKPDVSLLQAVWSDGGVQCCYAQRKKFSDSLSNGEEYFLENMDRICRKNFIPNIQDIMYIRNPTLGVQEHVFSIDNLTYRVIDVAGQKSLRKKWIHFFEGVTAVIFFASLSGYDEVLEEDTSINNLQDSLQAFHEVSHNHFLEKTDFILFLNKRDLFMEKVRKTSIRKCFPTFDGDNQPDTCLKYIREQFLQHKPGHKQVYIHVSCAIDVQMMKDILSNVVDIIVELNLRKAGNF
ncbi:LOW QUALITY PROTEIN: guanine nucleotide-binding protein G(t) subunit alpha-2-like [Haliotis rubra]|uniref:LOW QUALITY PROTEIN: guanine nucleotide-binding protein G(t) subunit alpha-2-like n=1 Tax=Haliotis rubra TaxID=36100 RepID=UPI001EE63341|nr:LOW QUALITY PROTEIN: guanine nucleotide-binding protein G(t) subunit alpha-2-like [Haliotis rubra]